MAETPGRRGLFQHWPFVAALVVAGVVTFVLVALLINISTRKSEERVPFARLVEVSEVSTDPEPWGMNWPRQFDSYRRTVDVTQTRYGGSSAIPQQKLDEEPWLKRMYAGYAFSIDYRERRGHAYMLYDQEVTERVTKKPQPGACLHCHASIVPTWRRVGAEALGQPTTPEALSAGFDWPAVMKGFEALSTVSYAQAHAELLKTPDGTPGENTPLMPGGTTTKTPTPANTPSAPPAPNDGAHANVPGEGHPVSCVDCHDPQTMAIRVTRPGFARGIQALAQSDAEEPFAPSIARWREGNRQTPYDPNEDASRQELQARVARIQDGTHQMLGRAAVALTDMLDAINAARAGGANEAQLNELYALQRSAQWRIDFVSSENSMGFHADQESARILGEAMDDARKAQARAIALMGQGMPKPQIPDAPVLGVTPTDRAPPGPYKQSKNQNLDTTTAPATPPAEQER